MKLEDTCYSPGSYLPLSTLTKVGIDRVIDEVGIDKVGRYLLLPRKLSTFSFQ